MIITLDIPDETVCAFFDFVRYDNGCYFMQGHSISSDELFDGNIVVIAKKETDNDRTHV